MRFLITLIYQQTSQEPASIKYLVALIAALGSIFVALMSAGISIFTLVMSKRNQSALQREQATLTSKNQNELANLQSKLTGQTQDSIERLRADLSEKGKERDARRDYEYEAHKRLYTECEPLVFQLAELSEHAYHRVHSLARSARLGKLPDWLDGDGYYLRSTMYRLLAPLVIFRLIQQRLTFVDLSLDTYIANQYRLLKLLYLTFTDPFEFASTEPKIEYHPDVSDWRQKRQSDPAVYWRQGLYLGTVDNAIDALIVNTDDRAVQAKTYGEFELDYADKGSETYQRLASFADMLHAFHPRNRPVLWRMLWAQNLIHQKIIDSQSDSSGPTTRVGLSALSPKLPTPGLDWRQNAAEASVEEALLIPEAAARKYLQMRLPDAFGERTERSARTN